MSFSFNVKSEVINIVNNRHCAIAELSAIINYSSKLHFGKNIKLIINSENKLLIKKTIEIINFLFNINLNISNRKSRQYQVVVDDKIIIEKLFSIIKQEIYGERICNPILVNSVCCKRAYIRGAFICTGYICDPQKSYHVEFINYCYIQAENLKNMINYFNIDSKIIEKKDIYVVYIKEGEQIVDLLNIIEAHKSLLDFENIRIIKDVRNNINRIVNCETANLNKIVSTGIIQKENIEFIKQKIGLDNLPKQLKEIAILRLENPDLSLKEIGEMLKPPISKSGVNHRLKKINNIAENLRGN